MPNLTYLVVKMPAGNGTIGHSPEANDNELSENMSKVTFSFLA